VITKEGAGKRWVLLRERGAQGGGWGKKLNSSGERIFGGYQTNELWVKGPLGAYWREKGLVAQAFRVGKRGRRAYS